MLALSSPPEIEPVPPTVEALGLNHWNTREFPREISVCLLFYSFIKDSCREFSLI